jgi:SAM-dependent methyltransferase
MAMSKATRNLRGVVIRYISPIVSPRRVLAATRSYPRYLRERREYAALPGSPQLRRVDDLPVLDEATPVTPFDPHYTYLDGWAARQVAALKPKDHVDVASRVSFAVGLSAFVPVTFVDIRPAEVALDGLHSVAGDLLALPFPDRSVSSLSCLHVIEHVGLGRYGDPLNPNGSRHAAGELARMLAPGGQLLLGLPVGRSRVQFNAHRIHDPVEVVGMFPELRLTAFAAIDDRGDFLPDAAPADLSDASYACGCYRFERPAA